MRKHSYNGSDTERVGNKTMTVGSNFRCTLFIKIKLKIYKDLTQ